MKKKLRAFTLLETLLYVALTALVVGAAVSLLVIIMNNKERSTVANEVEQNGMQIIQTISYYVQSADSISVPAQANTTNSMQLISKSGDTVLFSLSGGNLSVSINGGSAIRLNSNRTTISSLSFSNYSRNNSNTIIRIDFVLTHLNADGAAEGQYSRHFITSTSIKP